MTGSSDYHGAGKPNRLGENTTTPEVLRRDRRHGTGALPILRLSPTASAGRLLRSGLEVAHHAGEAPVAPRCR